MAKKQNDNTITNRTTKVVEHLWEKATAVDAAVKMCFSEGELELSYLSSMLYFLGMECVADVHSFLIGICDWVEEKTGVSYTPSDLGSSDRTYVVDGKVFRFQMLYQSANKAKQMISTGMGETMKAVLLQWSNGDPARWLADNMIAIVGECTSADPKAEHYIDPISLKDKKVLKEKINTFLKDFTEAVAIVKEKPTMTAREALAKYDTKKLAKCFATGVYPHKPAAGDHSSNFEDSIVAVLKKWDSDTAATFAAIAKVVDDYYTTDLGPRAARFVDLLFDKVDQIAAEVAQPKGRKARLADTSEED